MKHIALLLVVFAAFLAVLKADLWAAESADPKAKEGDVSQVVASLGELSERLDADLRQAGYAGANVAVMQLAEYGETTRQKELGGVVQGELNTKLASLGYTVVERERLVDILKEAELAQYGLIEDEKAAEVAGLLGADILIVGSISEFGDRFMINVRAVSREKGYALTAQRAEVHSAHLIALSSDAVVLKTRWDATYRSMIAPGWGQFYNDQPVKAGVFIAAELAAIGATLGLHFAGAAVEDDYKSLSAADFQANPNKRQELEDKRNRLWLARDIMIGVCVGVYVVNVLDAAISARHYTRTETGVVTGSGGGAAVAPAVFGDPDDPMPGFSMNLSY